MKISLSNSKFLLTLSSAGLLVGAVSCNKAPENLELPNILWITSEDNSPFLGCYGDSFAITPNLDKLAEEGFLYTHAYANAPVCAPARNTIITGVYANSGGNQHMRSKYPHSDEITMYPEYLKELGYYCTNNKKTDYNTPFSDTLWNENGRKAHYRNRKNGQPFFAIFNFTLSHESSIHKSIPNEDLVHDPAQVKLPPYHPDTPELRHDWAQYYDKITELDTQIGQFLKELEESGEAENTIVFYYGDHGGVLARSKRFVYESGTRVPFILRIPEKYKYLWPSKKPGEKVNRLISFVDLAPTLLSITGKKIPDFMQGNAFLGSQKTKNPEYAYMFRGRMDERLDMSRAIRDEKYRYIHNYMPYRIYGQHLNYLWRAPSINSWERAYNEGKCNDVQSIFWNTKPPEELYDTENDPWEVNNLAKDPNYQEVLKEMRAANNDWILKIKDAGFLPEGEFEEINKTATVYDYLRSGKINFEEIVESANVSTSGNIENYKLLLEYLQNDNSAIRYWGATGLLLLGDEAKYAIPELKALLRDSSEDVVAVVSEALYNLGEIEMARTGFLYVIKNGNELSRNRALNAIDAINDFSPEIVEAIIALMKKYENLDRNIYDIRSAKWLFEKWGIKPLDHGLKFKS